VRTVLFRELTHYLGHPSPREFYLGSPSWISKTQTQANTLDLLALWPRHRRLQQWDEDFLEQRRPPRLVDRARK
jgi:hypothetical protein